MVKDDETGNFQAALWIGTSQTTAAAVLPNAARACATVLTRNGSRATPVPPSVPPKSAERKAMRGPTYTAETISSAQ